MLVKTVEAKCKRRQHSNGTIMVSSIKWDVEMMGIKISEEIFYE